MKTSKFQPKQRLYSELCPIALSLEIIGERWTLLILRELFAGPKRFTDLVEGLPGIGSAILTQRLRELEKHQLVRQRRLGPPARALVYELAERGRGLDSVLIGLARWGAVYLPGRTGLSSRGRWLLQAMTSNADSPTPEGVESANFVVDGEECHVLVGDGWIGTRDGLAGDARQTIRASARDLSQFVTEGSVKKFAIEGDRRAGERLLRYLRSGLAAAR